MYGGEAVERGSVGEVFDDPQHPYTRGLLAALPRFDADKRLHPLTAIPGAPPAPRERPPGCRFGPRCARFIAGRCDSAAIPLRPLAAAPLHACRCVRAEDVPWHTARSGPSALSGLSALSGPSALSALSALSAQGAPSALSAQTAPAVPTASAAQAVPAARSVGEVVLRLREVTKRYGRVLANDAVSLEARRAETVAVVGESGSGKSTLARLVMGLTTATAGSIEFEGSELARLPVTRRGAKTVRALQMIFQDPHGTLNPRRTIGAQLARVIARLGADRDPRRITARVHELLELVRLPREFAARLPRQLSGGQRQRVGIARAFAGDPELVVADEPLAALDVSVQASVTGLLLDIQRARGTTLLFISHDLGMVRYLADRIVVMYQGQVMEQGAAADLLAPPYHPYTELLLASMPAMHGRKRPHAAGSEPAPGRWNAASPRPTAALNPPPGCRFYPRCAHRLEGTCDVLSPPWREFPRTHRIACHLPPARLVGIASVFSEGSA
jgi:peptide/nickel transport system ATP-binding protein